MRRNNNNNERRRRYKSKKLNAIKNKNDDSLFLKGNDVLAFIRSSSTSQNLPINGMTTILDLKPSVIGDRLDQVSKAFTRYRFKYIKLHYKSHVSSSTIGALALGIIDDDTNSDTTGNNIGFVPVVNLRCSNDASLWKNFSFTWTPIDPKKWYYTDTAGGDQRFSSQASLIASFDNPRGDNALLGSVRVEYGIVFEGGKIQYNDNFQNQNKYKLELLTGWDEGNKVKELKREDKSKVDCVPEGTATVDKLATFLNKKCTCTDC